MLTIQQKFAAFMSALSPEEQRAVIPLMKTFTDTMATPGGEPEGDEAPPLPPPGTEPMLKPPAAPPPTAVPGGPPLPPPDPMAMSIGRQVY
jgi:hypothetical protein